MNPTIASQKICKNRTSQRPQIKGNVLNQLSHSLFYKQNCSILCQIVFSLGMLFTHHVNPKRYVPVNDIVIKKAIKRNLSEDKKRETSQARRQTLESHISQDFNNTMIILCSFKYKYPIQQWYQLPTCAVCLLSIPCGQPNCQLLPINENINCKYQIPCHFDDHAVSVLNKNAKEERDAPNQVLIVCIPVKRQLFSSFLGHLSCDRVYGPMH